MECVLEYQRLPEPECPMCRGQFSFNELHQAQQLAQHISQTRAGCQWCKQQVYNILIEGPA